MRTLLLCCLVVAAGCSGKSDPDPGGPPAPSGTSAASGSPASCPEVAAVTLFDAFHDNVVAADQKYKDKPLAVKGTVSKIDREGLGFDVVADGHCHGYPPSVECRFHPTRRDELARVKKDQTVTVVGTCTGSREDSRAWQKVVVTLDGCRLGK